MGIHLHGLRRICVDETSYRKGHAYITVVYDMGRNQVVWVHEDHGQEILAQFCELMTEEDRAQIEIVAGDILALSTAFIYPPTVQMSRKKALKRNSKRNCSMEHSLRIQQKNIPFIVCILFIIIGITPIIWVALAGRYLSLLYAVLLGIWLIDLCSIIIQGHTVSQMFGLLLIYLGALVLFAVFNVYNFRAYFLNVFVAIFPMIIYCQYHKRIDTTALKNSAKWILVIYLITFGTTIIGLLENPYLIRELVVNLHDQKTFYLARNVGNMGHVYAAGLIFVICMTRLRDVKYYSTWKKIFYIFTVGLSITLVFMGSSGITVMTTVIGTIWALFIHKENKWRFVLLGGVILILILFQENIMQLLTYLSRITNNQYFSKKLVDIVSSLNYGEAVGDVAARTNRYLNSFMVYLHSFGLGVGPQYAQVYANNIVDSHSGLMGNLARYGTIWLIVMTTFFRRFCNSINVFSPNNNEGTADNEAVIVTFLMMFFLQPIDNSEEVMTVMFLILPFFDLIFRDINPDYRID